MTASVLIENLLEDALPHENESAAGPGLGNVFGTM